MTGLRVNPEHVFPSNETHPLDAPLGQIKIVTSRDCDCAKKYVPMHVCLCKCVCTCTHS